MVLHPIAIAWWNSKHIAGAKQEALRSLGIKGALAFVGVCIGNFDCLLLSSDDGKRLGAKTDRFGVLDGSGWKIETAHNVPGVERARAGNVESLGSRTRLFALVLLAPAKGQLAYRLAVLECDDICNTK